jgi:signal transduction histidine kinase/HAMP domain-containing protein
MSFLLTLLSGTTPAYIDLPKSLVGWLVAFSGWVLLAGVILYLVRRWRVYNRKREQRTILILVSLTIAVPITSLFFGQRLPAAGALSPVGLPVEPVGPAWMIFSALPWVLAAGLLGPGPAAALGAFSGLFLALWDTHNPYTPLLFALLAVLLGAALQQRYRTRGYALLRFPMIVTLLLSLFYPLLFVVVTAFGADGALADRLDFALTRLSFSSLAGAGMLLVAGLFAQILSLGLPRLWGGHGELEPAPAEKSLQARFLYNIIPLAFVLTLLLMVGDWIVAERASRQILRERMEDAAQMAAQGVPYFLETGQSLVMHLATDQRLYGSPANEVVAILSEGLRRVPFFTQLYYLDSEGRPVAGYPTKDYTGALADEQRGIETALNGFPHQPFSAPPLEDQSAARVSFVIPVKDNANTVRGVLIGRTDLASNPFTLPLIKSLQSFSVQGGIGYLLDDDGNIIYHPDANLLMSVYGGRRPENSEFYDGAASDGTRSLVYYQPAIGRPWAIVLEVPARRAQQLAVNLAAPLLGMILILAAISGGLLRFGLGRITGSLRKLALQTESMAQGELEDTLVVAGEDEVASLSRAFEQMRLSLKARLEELNRLLLVSQGVASSLEVSEAVAPVLEAAFGAGVSSARVVLIPTVVPDLDGDAPRATTYARGLRTEAYEYLDEQILEITRRQERVVLNNPSRPRLFSFPARAQRPEALLALPLRHENIYYGALWLGYDKPHRFTEEELRFMTTLAGQAALAAANAHLYMNAEIGRQRLAAVLASTPDPVLVIDQQNCLLLSNPAAWRVLGLGVEWEDGLPIEQIIQHKELLELLESAAEEKRAAEVDLGEDRAFYAIAAPVLAEGHRVGRVCILRDITYFKELDALKSEFVATVSHDLRSPLTLMRGYATMLEMVGELNEQQSNYVRRIVSGVESMSRLVSNLLDLGRIEAGIGLQLEMVPVHDIVDRVVGALQLQATQKRIALTAHIPEHTIPLIEADQALLQQSLHNLVENAIKYTEPGGQVSVRLSTRPDSLVFAVTDTGIGIAPVDQPRLFEKFFRGVQQGPKKSGGSGLGLAIVKSVVERHGGQVWVESQLGKGSTFYISIPLRQPKN